MNSRLSNKLWGIPVEQGSRLWSVRVKIKRPRSENDKCSRSDERSIRVPEDRESSNRLAAVHDPRTNRIDGHDGQSHE